MTKTKYIKLSFPADEMISRQILQLGVREMSRQLNVSPGLISLFAKGKCSMREKIARPLMARARSVKLEVRDGDV